MSAVPDAALQAWIERVHAHAIPAMLRSVSATGLVKERPGFGTTVRPVRGSIIASPVPGAYDPDPDYFFHWFRDSAVVIEAIGLLHDAGALGDEAVAHFGDFLDFALALNALDGRAAAKVDRRGAAVEKFQQYLRDDADLAGVTGDRVVAETRVNPDGTLDISKWARPQHDGAPLRALATLRWRRLRRLPSALAERADTLIRADLDFTLAHWREPSYDIWEEDLGHHYYTLRVAAAAFEEGADWAAAGDDAALASTLRAHAAAVRTELDDYWRDDLAAYVSRRMADGGANGKDLDIAVILSAVHAWRDGDAQIAHSVRDPRQQSTLSQLELLFEGLYAINRDRAADSSPALGRYARDVYFSGGAYYFSTLGAAEFCYRAALGSADAERWIAHGDGYLRTVQRYTPASAELSEQFDRDDGHQTSARHLAWSYACFISTIAARRQALTATRN